MAANFWWWLASLVVGELLKPRVERPQDAAPQGFEFPTIEEARVIPYVAGTVILRAPNVCWWGDYQALPIRKKVGRGGFFGLGDAIYQTVGHRYYCGAYLGLCMGEVSLVEIRFEDRVAWSSGATTIRDEAFFGGEDSRGGLALNCDFLRGDTSQATNSYLAAQLGADLPAWRGVAGLVIEGPSGAGFGWDEGGNPAYVRSGYIGTQPRIPELSVVVRRFPALLGVDSNLDGSANPAEIIYDLLTRSEDLGGAGIPTATIDTASFIALGTQLASENFGLDVVWDKPEPLGNLLDQILRTIDAVLWLDHSTGLWTIKAARAEYEVGTLLELDATNSSLESLSLPTPDELTSEVVVSYTDRAESYQTRQVRAQQPALARRQGQMVTAQISYPFVHSKTLASRLAWRDLRVLSLPLAKLSLTAHRVAYSLRPGSVFKHTWLGVSRVFRVQSVDLGELGGPVRISAIQDVFDLGTAVLDGGGGTLWEDPLAIPGNAAVHLEWMPYFLWDGENENAIWICARSLDQFGKGYDVQISAATVDEHGAVGFGGYSLDAAGVPFCPSAQLYAALDPTPGGRLASLRITGTLDVDAASETGRRAGQNLALIQSAEYSEGIYGELISFEGCSWDPETGETYLTDVWRGVLDSPQVSHAAGARIWIPSWGQTYTRINAGPLLPNKIKIQPFGARGSLPLVDTTELEFDSPGSLSRGERPYPVALPRVNGADTLETSVGETLVATWRHRNRLTQIGVIPQDDPSAASAELTYFCHVWVGDNTYIARMGSDLTGETWSYSAAHRLVDDADGTKTVKFAIVSANASGQSESVWTDEVVMTGFGMTFGMYFGGVEA